MNHVEWSYYNKFDAIMDKYLKPTGDGDCVADQAVTAVTKLVYKWYNDGDVYDNTYALPGWWNDLSSYANWLWSKTTEEVALILETISKIRTEDEYETLLKSLADTVLHEDYLEDLNKKYNNEKVGSVYECPGPFKYEEQQEEDDDCWEEEEDYEDEEEEE